MLNRRLTLKDEVRLKHRPVWTP